MGDPNGQVELACPGCDTTFHLRPRKAKMPRSPIPCPKCGTPIELTDAQVRELRSIVGQQTPSAQVLKGRSNNKGVSDDALDEMERLASELEANKKGSSTLIGHPVAVGDFQRTSRDHKTRESSESQRRASQSGTDLDDRPKTSEIPLEQVERAREKMLADEEKLSFSSFGADSEDVDTSEEDRHNSPTDVLKPDDTPTDVHNATTLRPPGMPPAPSPLSEVTDSEPKPAGKVPLSELLKKVRKKRDTEGIPVPSFDAPGNPPDSSSAEALSPSTDEVFDDIVDDVVGGATERLTPVREAAPSADAGAASDIGAPSSTGRSESSMLARLKKIPRSGLREKPGMAGERRGSGFIRLPESEILDLLGDGNYRIRVHDIVYEPIGEEALADLIKVGKLKGKDEIAEADGDWGRLKDHRLFLEHRPEPIPPADTPLPKPGQSTKQMFGAAPKVPPPPPANADDSPPEGIKKRTSSSSGEWVQTNLDATLDNLPVADASANTPPPDAAEVEAEEVEELEALQDLAEPADGPVFPDEDEDYKLDGPPSYPAIELPEAAAEPAAPALPKEKKSGGLLPLVAGVFILGGVVAGGGFLYSSGALDGVLGNNANVPQTTASNTTAQTTVAETTAQDVEPAEPSRDEKLEAAVAAKDWAVALPMLRENFESDASYSNGMALVDALLATDEHRRARTLLNRLRSAEGADTDAIESRFSASLEAHAELERVVVEVTSDWSDAKLISKKPLNFRIVDPDGVAWRFIPAQDDQITPRAEIAFYQLCGIVACGFEVPETKPATVSEETLSSWKDAGVDVSRVAVSNGVADGALRRAVEEEHVGYPIEVTNVWRRWLDSNNDESLETPLAESLASLDESTRTKVLDASGDADTAAIARQIANVLAADFLVNNFARFANQADDFGSTLRIANGQLISVTNSAAFQPRDSNRVRGRFGWTSRFGSEFVDSVRRMDRAKVDPILFPNASRGEKARLDIFWDQRDAMLKRVDDLVSKRSKEAVQPF